MFAARGGFLYQSVSVAESYWMAVVYGGNFDVGYGVAIDSDGNVIVAGLNDNVTSYGFFLTKFNTSGTLQWQRRLAAPTGASGYGVAVDSNNDIYICGEATDTDTYIQLAKYNSSGTIQWQRSIGTSTKSSTGYSIAVDSSGVYVAGKSNANVAAGDARIIKYNSSGTLQWQYRLYAATGSQQARGISLDTGSNVYISGSTTNTSNSTQAILMAKYDSSGTIQWQRRLDSISDDFAYGSASDSSGNAYLCGSGGSSSNFTLAKYNTSGTLQWQRWLTGASGQANGIAVDSSGNVYSCGTSDSKLLIVKYNSTGTIQWQRTITTNDSSPFDYGTSIVLDSSGTNLYITGFTTVSSVSRLFIAKLPTDGSLTGTYALGGVNYTYAAGTLTAANSTLTGATITLTSGTGSLTSATSTLTGSTPTLTTATKTL